MLEIDLSLANIGLDLIGQATHFLRVAGEAEGKGRDADALAFHRDVLDFRNCLLVEQPNGDFAQTIARQFLFSNWQEMLLREICGADVPLAAIAQKAVKEVAYHVRFANEWTIRLGDGTTESRARMIAGLDWCGALSTNCSIPKKVRRRCARNGMRASPKSWRKRDWKRPSHGVAPRVGERAIIPNISAIC
jgi:phenylacetate-CoA oxygenase PaaI subunit